MGSACTVWANIILEVETEINGARVEPEGGKLK
jgi:hypothetical protein